MKRLLTCLLLAAALVTNACALEVPTDTTVQNLNGSQQLIKTYTLPGEVVADICAGSGTTAVAALNTGRCFVCFETAPAFYAAASERIHTARGSVESGEKGV